MSGTGMIGKCNVVGNVLFGSVLKIRMDGQMVTDNVNVPRLLADEFLIYFWE